MAAKPKQNINNNDLVFLGINFSSFFKHCDCIKHRVEDALSVASSDAEDQSKHMSDQKKQRFFTEEEDIPPTKDTLDSFPVKEDPPLFEANDGHSTLTGNEWVDLDEFALPEDIDLGQLTLVNNLGQDTVEEYFTADPIDFDCKL